MRVYLNGSLLLSALLLSPLAMYAEGATNGANAYNPLLIGLVCLIVVLLFAIGMIANVLRQLASVYSDKVRAEKSKNGNVIKTVLLLLALSASSFHAFAAEAVSDTTAKAAPVSNMIAGVSKDDFYLIMGVIALELLVIFALSIYMRVMVKLLAGKYDVVDVPSTVKRVPFWDRFNKAVAIEKEHDILLDHNYDGIQELDNSLPPWWKYGFYLTIIFACIYIYRYQIAGTGPSSLQEYQAEVKQADEDKAAYLAKSANNVDENSVKALTEANDLAAGKQIFETTCFACHAKDGGGGVGPNLTDDYWLHGGSIKDVFKSIKYGWQDKGMKSWKDDFSPKQIAQIASYVKSLHGTKPAVPKDKQGELYIEGGAAPANAADTAKKVATN